MLDEMQAASEAADVLDAFRRAGVFRLAVAGLPGASGLDAARCAAAVARVLDDGWAVLWAEAPEGPELCLTPLAAERLGVGVGSAPDAPAPAPSLGPPARPDQVADPGPGPAELAEWNEGVEREARRAARAGKRRPAGDLPAPTVVLTGTALRPWDERGMVRRHPRMGPVPKRKAKRRKAEVVTTKGPCPVCRERALRPCEYCAACCRWGLDHLLPRGAAARKEAS